jgi:hypothetical protein
MPRRKAKRSVGRPKKRSIEDWNSLIAEIRETKDWKFSKCGERDQQEILKLLQSQSPEVTMGDLGSRKAKDLAKALSVVVNKLPWIETEIDGLFELKELKGNFSLSNPGSFIPELPEILAIIEEERKTTWQTATLYDSRKQAGKYASMRATMYAFIVKQLLQEIRQFSVGEDKGFQDWIAVAIELGRLSVAMQAVSKVPEFQEGRESKLNREKAAKNYIKERISKEEVEAALAKHAGRKKKTSAIEHAARGFGVGKTTFRKWMKDYGIE